MERRRKKGRNLELKGEERKETSLSKTRWKQPVGIWLTQLPFTFFVGGKRASPDDGYRQRCWVLLHSCFRALPALKKGRL